MNYLKGKRCYLSGPIQNDDSQINWRTEPIKKIKNYFEMEVFDPFSDPKQQWVPVLKKAYEEKDYETLARIAKAFVKKDLSQLDRADLVIAYLPHKVLTTGTHHEIINSNNAKKPTLLVTNTNDIGDIPWWYFGCIKKEFFFPNWDALYVYLEEVNQDKHHDNNRWSYIYGDI